MNDEDMKERLHSLEQKIDAIFISVEKMRNYFKWTMYITVALIVLPLIALMFVGPSFLSTYQSIGNLGL